jgi:hypothetical protein
VFQSCQLLAKFSASLAEILAAEEKSTDFDTGHILKM